MAKAGVLEAQTSRHEFIMVFNCPGCNRAHMISLDDYLESGGGVGHSRATGPEGFRNCVYRVDNGIVKYSADTTHKYAGKAIAIPAINERGNNN